MIWNPADSQPACILADAIKAREAMEHVGEERADLGPPDMAGRDLLARRCNDLPECAPSNSARTTM